MLHMYLEKIKLFAFINSWLYDKINEDLYVRGEGYAIHMDILLDVPVGSHAFVRSKFDDR